MSRTKILGGLMFAGALCYMAVDLLDGGGFNVKHNVEAIMGASGGAGLWFLRDAIQKVLDVLSKK